MTIDLSRDEESEGAPPSALARIIATGIRSTADERLAARAVDDLLSRSVAFETTADSLQDEIESFLGEVGSMLERPKPVTLEVAARLLRQGLRYSGRRRALKVAKRTVAGDEE